MERIIPLDIWVSVIGNRFLLNDKMHLVNNILNGYKNNSNKDYNKKIIFELFDKKINK